MSARHSATSFSNFRDERKWASRAIHGTPEEVEFASIIKSLDVDIHAKRPTLIAEARANLAEIDRILAQADLASIDAEFDRNRKGKRNVEVERYVLTGKDSIRQIADAVDRRAEYEMFYGKGSRITHTASYKAHVRFHSGQVHFKPVRHVAEFGELLNFLVAVTLGTYRKVLTFYRPGELPAFTQKYRTEWREPFLNVKSVIYST